MVPVIGNKIKGERVLCYVAMFLSHNNTFINQPPFHITLPLAAHSMDNIELVPLELITSNRDTFRKAREAFLISKGKTFEPSGLNRRNEI